MAQRRLMSISWTTMIGAGLLQVILVLGAIYRENVFVTSLYQLQRSEQTKQQLITKRRSLHQSLQKQKERNKLRNYVKLKTGGRL